MWVYILFITVTFISPTDQLEHKRSKALNVFPTIEACLIDMNDLAKKMAEAYPNATDYKISCERREKINPLQPGERNY